ncbi:head completion/stabilization protein [Pseudomonas sp. CCC3.1]|uniref:head completion/stabilization protein n=1 Tax=Pseudomonas sp. CCC3.1 TaxID=3048607 RepID=UPI002AC9610E|nr:head completion/stabilization protein [Pseudomonas sp. CCC3.1]MEB0206217.1 head completion/stabilization protein [Pseudomonas sp. CCC3.1]WPX34963.1 head completion/stabilization protein [Pseudomonas sp. CCC3.1]
MNTPITYAPTFHCPTDDTFWPPVNLRQLRDALSLNSTISEARLKIAALGATSKVNKTLAAWRFNFRQQGYVHLEHVPAPSIDDCSILVTYYINAIETTTALELFHHLKVAECGRACHLDEVSPKGLFTCENRHHDE